MVNLQIIDIKRKNLEVIYESLLNCDKCKLHQYRKDNNYKPALYRGNPEADVMFVGESPGLDEATKGLPFVGRAGKLLDNMIKSMGYKSDNVYICNVVNDRPPNNRKPEPDEITACINYLYMQIWLVKPLAIITLGATATDALLGQGEGITKRRGNRYKINFSDINNISSEIEIFPTFHPSYLLRKPEAKQDVWNDLQKVKNFVDNYPWAE